MKQLVTASVGLYIWKNIYYLQVIFAESQESFTTQISKSIALNISKTEDIEIVEMPQ